MSAKGEAFLEQNVDFARDLTDDDRSTVELYADHYAGGLIVLQREFGDGMGVKAHDDWSDEGIVVHVYDYDDPDVSWLAFFTSGHAALDAFLSVEPADLDAAPWERWT